MREFILKYKPFIYLTILIPFSILGIYLLYNNSPLQSSIYPSCPVYSLAKLHCPGCGTARALHDLVHFRLLEAIDHNPMTIFFTPIIIYSIGAYFVREFFGKRLPEPFKRARSVRILLVVIIVFTILRNIPYSPFTILAP